MLNKLIGIANTLDEKGLHAEADILDRLLKQLASFDMTFPRIETPVGGRNDPTGPWAYGNRPKDTGTCACQSPQPALVSDKCSKCKKPRS